MLRKENKHLFPFSCCGNVGIHHLHIRNGWQHSCLDMFHNKYGPVQCGRGWGDTGGGRQPNEMNMLSAEYY